MTSKQQEEKTTVPKTITSDEAVGNTDDAVATSSGVDENSVPLIENQEDASHTNDTTSADTLKVGEKSALIEDGHTQDSGKLGVVSNVPTDSMIDDTEDPEKQQLQPQCAVQKNHEKVVTPKKDPKKTSVLTIEGNPSLKFNIQSKKGMALIAFFVVVMIVIPVVLAVKLIGKGNDQNYPTKLEKYPECFRIHKEPQFLWQNDWLAMLGDKHCDKVLNSRECGYDDGDCDRWNKKYENCPNAKYMNYFDDHCKKASYNTPECGYQDGKCIEFNTLYPNCTSVPPDEIGNGRCHDRANTEECGWDGGDCIPARYPNCTGVNKDLFHAGGENDCLVQFNTEECGFHKGRCDWFNQMYPNCNADPIVKFNSTKCVNTLEYNNEECGWHAGACDKYNDFMTENPDCNVTYNVELLGDGKCHNDLSSYNSEACQDDGLDCVEFNNNASYANCTVYNAWALGNGKCEHYVGNEMYKHNTAECGYDGGDCIEFNKKYPSCNYLFPEDIGNGKCNMGADNAACDYDGGDCERVHKLKEMYPKCDTSSIYKDIFADGKCDSMSGDLYVEKCGWEGNDCKVMHDLYPLCRLYNASMLGDGICQNESKYGYQANTPECLFDGGDCNKNNEMYPKCISRYRYFGNIANGVCELFIDAHNEDCGWDGGDCEDFMKKYPLCPFGVYSEQSQHLVPGDGICSGFVNQYPNVEECGYEAGDCDDFNAKYPNCTFKRGWYDGLVVNQIGDGHCDYELDTSECGYDGGDCL